jgi:hypothetical protein
MVGGGGPSDGLPLFCFNVEGLRPNADWLVVTLTRLGEREAAW